jgi:P2 family phage contractile tail tube protein
MNAARNIRKSFTFFADGIGYAGNVKDFTSPVLELKTEDFQAGGMYAPIKITMGHNPLDSEVTLLCDDAAIMSLFSVREGQQYPFNAREALESANGDVIAAIHTMRGKVVKIDRGQSAPGQMAEIKLSLSLTYYKLTHGDVVVHEFDIPNMVAIKDGVDILAPIRAALAI